MDNKAGKVSAARRVLVLDEVGFDWSVGGEGIEKELCVIGLSVDSRGFFVECSGYFLLLVLSVYSDRRSM